MALLSLPGEVLLAIISHLDIPSIIRLRQTCTQLLNVTRDKSIWSRIFSMQKLVLPVSDSLNDPLELSSVMLEQAVAENLRISREWPRYRIAQPRELQTPAGESLMDLEIFLDIWLLVFYADGFVHLWDLRRADPVPCATVALGSKQWSSYATTLDVHRRTVTLAITREPPYASSITLLYQLSFDPPRFLYKRSFGAATTPFLVQDLDPLGNLIAFSRSCLVEIVHWDEVQGDEVAQIATQTEELEEMYTNIVALRFSGPYVMVFKTRSLEFHPIPSIFASHIPDFPVLKHPFPNSTFRTVDISKPKYISRSTSTLMSFSLLAYDVMLGLFHFIADLYIPNEGSDTVPWLNVHLVGVNDMIGRVDKSPTESPLSTPSRSLSIPEPRVVDPSESPTPHSSQPPLTIVNQNAQIHFHHTHSPSSSHAFVSSLALGPRGMRAIWVSRSRGSLVREVVACDLSGLQPGKTDFDLPVELDGKSIHSARSPDLREFWTHCALAEASGTIALGNRVGHIFVLDV